MSTATYENSVFINCPFDPLYWPLFEAITFSVYDLCGFSEICRGCSLNSGAPGGAMLRRSWCLA